MQALFKTLFGSVRTIAVGALSLGVAFALLHGPLPVLAGVVLPIGLLLGAGYLARH